MKQRKPLVLLLVAAGLMLLALILLYVTAPSPTVLLVQVVDAETGEPLAGARVWAQAPGEQALPTALTDERGMVRFHGLPPRPAYRLCVQQVGYDLACEPQVEVPASRETAVTLFLSLHAAARLFVGLNEARIAVIDTASLLIVQTFALPAPPQAPVRHLLAHPDKELLYAVAGDQGYLLDSQDGRLLARMEVSGSIESLDLSADGQHLVITGLPTGHASAMPELVHLLILDAQTGNRLADRLLTSVNLEERLRWRPDGTDIYVLCAAECRAWKLDDAILREWRMYDLPTGPRRSRGTGILSGDGRYLSILHSGYLFHTPAAPTSTVTLQGFFPGGEPYGLLTTVQTDLGIVFSREVPAGISALAASPAKREVYALSEALGTLYILDPIGSEPPTLLAVGARPVALTVSADGQWLYVANLTSQTISVIHLPSAAVKETIQLPAGPLSLTLRQGGPP